MAESRVQRVTSRVVSAVYILAGAIKFPVISSIHENMRKQFVVFNRHFPGNAVGLRLDPVTYLYCVGALELSMGLGLLLGPRKVKLYCCQGLMIIMVGAVYTLMSIGDYGQAVIPSAFLTSLTYLWYSYWTDRNKKNV